MFYLLAATNIQNFEQKCKFFVTFLSKISHFLAFLLKNRHFSAHFPHI